MNFIKKYIKDFFIISICLVISATLAHYFTYTNSAIIEFSFILTILVTLFSVLLAIVTLMITVLDKYKDNTANQNAWAESSTAVLKALSENSIFLLVLIFLIIILHLFQDLLLLIPKINVVTVFLICSLLLALLITFDTTISVHILVIHLKDALANKNNEIIELTTTEKNIIEAYRLMTPKYQTELEEYLSTLILKQQIRENNNTPNDNK